MLRTLFALAFISFLFASCDTETTDYGPIDQKIIEDYLAANNLTAQSTASGLYYIIEEPGGTNHPNINSYVVVYYKGYFTDGTVFDSAVKSPVGFELNSVIKGWQEGMQLIGVKGKIQLFVPSALGYGSEGKGSVPGNTVTIFDIELVEFY
jgi:FKBP-type peptidyl-prolyl cis-trans isomerase FkpA